MIPRPFRQIWALLRDPGAFQTPENAQTWTMRAMTVRWLVPLGGIRVLATFVSSLFVGEPGVGLVLAVGTSALLAGSWLALVLVLPALAAQFGTNLSRPSGLGLATFASVPLWLAGVFFVFPEDPWWLLLWSRLVVALAASYGLLIFYRGLEAHNVSRRRRAALAFGFAAAFLSVHAVLYALIGTVSHVILWIANGH